MTTRDNRSPDLSGPRDDPDHARLVGDLGRLHAATLPPQRDQALARLLHERASASERRDRPARRLRPPTRPLILLVAALLGVSLVAGVAVAEQPPLSLAQLLARALSVFAVGTGDGSGAGQARHVPFGRAVNLAQSACGYTVAVKRVYADADRIVVGYTVTGPAGRSFDGGGFSPTFTLTDAHGHTFAPDTGGGPVQGNREGAVTDFDASGVAGLSGTLALRLTSPTMTAYEKLGGAPPVSVPCETYSHVGEAGYRWVTIVGPFTYNFTVPMSSVSPSRVADRRQKVTVGGTTATLERAVITPYETVLSLRGIPGEQTLASLVVGGRTIDEEMNGEHAGLTTYRFATPRLYGWHGAWTATITPRPDLAQAGQRRITGGPWIFHINE